MTAARQVGHLTRLPSLELSTDPPRSSGNCDSGYSCAYQFNLSWINESTPAPAERDPRLVFEKMFGSGNQKEDSRRRHYRKSILDFVMDDAKRLQSRLGATDREVAALADAFAYDIDFQRDVRSGDDFELVFERYYDDEGNTVRTGEMLFISLESRRGARAFYSFLAPGDTRPDWYDAEGKSARRFLMKTPINGARLSSGFGMRRHPVLGYSRMHRGTDFAAPIGTPILAAGDGTIVRAGPFSSYGNYVRIRHANGYETAYAHMSRFARGMRAGVRVRQGQVIGYVGNTGRSTGPHLHYEVLRRGQQQNPMTLRVANGRNLSGRALELFNIERDRIDTLRQVRAQEAPVEAVGPGAADGAL